ncbi:hypothetical protein [Mycolicibacterium frederiksbergense]|uniref:Uncharacterized protein n=1 Tax=Mycolicibacterium frederiksbergense TaxID=117567 RepID=A0A6H0S0E4_9MYCO|nr:hypothetical protein [Mycolicibacterium frederiksbergense]QIV79795.1 hypothetical protein EXE63_01460 [Mycolicibacterium frederiksbergense]
MTVMDNVHRTDWLISDLDCRAYRYRARSSRLHSATEALQDLLAGSGNTPAAALLHFAREATDAESRALTRGLKERPASR